MGINEVRQIRIKRAKNQIKRIEEAMLEEAMERDEPIFELVFYEKLYSGVKDYFTSEGWNVKEISLKEDGGADGYSTTFTISKEADVGLEDLKDNK